MFLFLMGLAIGGIMGMILISVLSVGAIADERIEIMSRNFDKFHLESKNK